MKQVAPFTGAWIEIPSPWQASRNNLVAPFTGAWIEITASYLLSSSIRSRPSRARGLKSIANQTGPANFPSRALHGRVD